VIIYETILTAIHAGRKGWSLFGVVRAPEAELETVKRLRRLRDELQHGGAKFNYRSGLALARGAILLSNRIALADFEVWMGDLLDPNDLWAMLRIPEFAATAAHVTAIRLEAVKSSPGGQSLQSWPPPLWRRPPRNLVENRRDPKWSRPRARCGTRASRASSTARRAYSCGWLPPVRKVKFEVMASSAKGMAGLKFRLPASVAAGDGTLVFTFDRAMGTDSYSVMGEPAKTPTGRAKPTWDASGRVLTWPVRFEAGTSYRFSLNSATRQGFKSKEGVALAPVEVTLATK
jgi:hypothetical protein